MSPSIENIEIRAHYELATQAECAKPILIGCNPGRISTFQLPPAFRDYLLARARDDDKVFISPVFPKDFPSWRLQMVPTPPLYKCFVPKGKLGFTSGLLSQSHSFCWMLVVSVESGFQHRGF